MPKNADNNGNKSRRTSASDPSGTVQESEADFLAAEAEQARRAMKLALADLKASLAQGADVRRWAREHPLAAAGIAVTAGFVAAGAAIPSKRQQEIRRQAAAERAAFQDSQAAQASRSTDRGFLATLGKEALEALRPAIISWITTTLSADPTPHNDESDRSEQPADSPPDD